MTRRKFEFCTRIGCGQPTVTRGLCKPHYEQGRRVKKPAPTPRVPHSRRVRTPLGLRLTALREQNGLPVRTLCAATGIDHNTYARMLSDSNAVSLKYYVWLALQYGMTVSELLDVSHG